MGARNKLQQRFKDMSHDKIKKFLHETRAAWIDWSHNALAAAHIGGI